jgi:hypothetical protein
MTGWSIATLSGLLAALIPLFLAVGAGFYSAVQRCNEDASAIEDQLTSTLLEIQDRETRMKLVLTAPGTVANDKLIAEQLVEIENGADGHYGDPSFKAHTLVSLVNQYNRLLRRVQFPPELTYATALGIDTKTAHPAIETLDITKADAHAFTQTVDEDLKQLKQQQDWHESHAPVRRCSVGTLTYSLLSDRAEPWRLIRLVKRSPPGG